MSKEILIVEQKVKVSGKYGEIIECGDKYKVKFDDGSFGFFDEGQIEAVVFDTELKGSRMKEQPEGQMMEATATGLDPMAQPINNETPKIGEEETVLGKSVARDIMLNKEEFTMKKKKVLDNDPDSDEEVEKEEDLEEEKKKSKKELDEEETEKSDDEDKDDVEKSEDSEDDEEEKKKKKKAKKEAEEEDDVEKAGLEEDPEEAEDESTDSEHTISPNASVPSQSQNVFVPPSDVKVDREQSTPMDKSVNPDLMKSPLFVNLSSQIDGIRDAVSKKVDALEKSVNDRLSNVLKDMGKLEKFYKQSFYKAVNENVSPESTQAQTITKQLEDGKVRFRQ